jgi:citrate lyase subunit beta/citryl-CoA lyase/(S)-citramalyl-CoA lyase
LRTADGLADVLAVTEALSQGTPLAMLMVPKVESAQELALLRSVVGVDCSPLWPIIESAEGLKAAWEICAAPGLGGVLFGGVDYAADLGSDMGWDALFLARSSLAVACARSGIGLLDVPYLDVGDEAGLQGETMRVKAMGFQGRACIHPAQVAPVNAVFCPSPSEVLQAQRVVDAFAAAKGNAALLDGKMIELPVVRSAQRILDSAARAQNGKTL